MLRMAWRNLWRNKRRTLITLVALTLGTMAITLLHSYRECVYGDLQRNLTTQMVGSFQVHGRGWQREPDLANTVRDPVAVEAVLHGRLPGIRSERRVIGYGLAGTRDNSVGVMVLGLQPDRDGLLVLERGVPLGADPNHRIMVGRGLSEMLEVGPGDELVLVGQAADGSVANDRYTVAGVADAGSGELNGSAVFLHLADAQEFFGLGDGVHQILVHLPSDAQDVATPVNAVRAALDVQTLEALSWTEIMPELKGMMDQKRQKQHVVDVIVFLIVVLGVLNAMTMATFERTREFGVMSSLGTRRGRILGLVLSESLLQGALGLAAGVVLAGCVLYGLGDISLASLVQGADVLGVRFPATTRLRFQAVGLVSAAVTVGLTCLLGGLWPALRASRLQPAEATRYV